MEHGVKEILDAVKCFDRKEKLEIINFLLEEQEATLESVSKALGIKKSTAYKYLREMLDAGIVTYRKLPGKKGRMLFKIEKPSLSIEEGSIRDAFNPKRNEKRLIIFDVDDTLIRRSDIPEQLSSAGRNAIREAKIMLQEKGVPVSMPPEELFTPEWIFSKYGNSIEWYISTWLNVSGVPDGEIKKSLVVKHVREYYRSIEMTAMSCKPFGDVKPFLKSMNERFHFAAISNSSKRTVVENFRNNDILRYFMRNGKPIVVGGDEIPKSMETIDAVLRMSGIGAKNAFMVGDTGGDMKVAREAGIQPGRTISISRGITPIEPIKAIRPGVRIIKGLHELEYLLS